MAFFRIGVTAAARTAAGGELAGQSIPPREGRAEGGLVGCGCSRRDRRVSVLWV